MTGHELGGHGGGEHGVGFEKSDVDARAILRFGAIVATVALIAAVLTVFLYDAFSAHLASQQPPPPIMGFDPGRQPGGGVLLQETPILDLAERHAQEHAAVEGYAWVDEAAGIVRIPVDRALEIVAREGLPVRETPEDTPSPAPSPKPAATAAVPAGGLK